MDAAMNEQAIPQAMIREIVARVKCVVCSHHFRASDLQVLGRRGNAWAMRVHCPMCHTQALLFAVLTEHVAQTLYSDLTPDEWERFNDRPPISTDDVIAFHTYIRAYDGDFSEILDEPLPPE
jgi:ribosomal protein S27E